MKKILFLLLFLPVFARGQTLTGTITASGCFSVNVLGSGTVGINVSGSSWTGTIQPKVLGDTDGNATASNAQVTPYSSNTAQSTITANGDYSATVVGMTWFQLCGNTVTNTATVKLTPVRLAANRNAGTGNGTVTGSSLTAGQPIVGNGSGAIQTSSDWIDATAFSGADPCAKILAALQSASVTSFGQVVDARGFGNTTAVPTWPNIPCSVNPIPTASQGYLILPAGVFRLRATWTIPNRFTLIGQGWDANPGTGVGATTLMGCKSADTGCASTNFPTNIGGILLCWQDNAGGCGNANSSPAFNAEVIQLAIDCESIAGAIGVQDENAQEGSGLRHVKIMNCGNSKGRFLQIAGSNYPSTGAGAQVTATNGSATVTDSGGTAFSSDLINTQITLSGDGTATKYIVTAINAAGTSLTISPVYAGAGTNSTAQVSQQSGNTQNGSFSDLYFVNKLGVTTTADSIEILMNTGSGSFAGPKFIREVTAVNGAATQFTNTIEMSGAVTALEEIHLEACGTNCIVFGLDANTQDLKAINVWTGGMPAGTINQVLISNAFTTFNITVTGQRTVPSNPVTNTLQDQVCTNTAADTTLEFYYLGPSCSVVLTSSATLTSKLFALNLGTVLPQASGGLNTAKVAFTPPTTAATIAFAADNTTTTLPLNISNAQTGTYQAVAADFAACKTIPVASGTFALTLVASGTQPANGQCIFVVNYGTGVVTITRSGQNINGSASNYTLPAGSAGNPESALVWSDGANYFIAAAGGNIFNSAATCGSGLAVAGGGTNTVQCLTQLTFNASGVITKTNNESTTGLGVPFFRGTTSQKSESAADTNVLTVTPASTVGAYRACFNLSVSAASAATLGWTMTWTDSNGTAQTPTNLSLFQTGVAAPALTFTTSVAANYYNCVNFDVNNAGTSIVVKLTFAGTSFTAKATASVERISN